MLSSEATSWFQKAMGRTLSGLPHKRSGTRWATGAEVQYSPAQQYLESGTGPRVGPGVSSQEQHAKWVGTRAGWVSDAFPWGLWGFE